MTLTTIGQRPASAPTGAAVQGTAGAAIGQAAAALILTTNPELVLLAPVIGTAVTGVLSGLGAAARDRLHRDPSGLIGLLARAFAWLG